MLVMCCVFFFFSSRRRHTRYWRDWSSDVCSSDLVLLVLEGLVRVGRQVELQAVGDDEARVDLPVADPLEERLGVALRSEEHTSELQSRQYLVCRLLLEKKKNRNDRVCLPFSQHPS